MPPVPTGGLALTLLKLRDCRIPRGSLSVTLPVAAPKKSPSMTIRRDAAVVLLASTYGRSTWSSSGVVVESSQPVPAIGSSGVSSCVVRPGHASQASEAVR